jgi:hypothetical protein
MDRQLDTAQALTRSDWRLRASVILTGTWLVMGFLYISSQVGWTSFVTQRAPELGSFLEGAFAPLAFLWLVVGFFLQQQQLEQNTQTIERQLEVMRETAKQAEVQARAIAADEMHSRQDVFMRIKDTVSEQLGTIGGFLVTSWAAGIGTEQIVEQGGINGLWRTMGGGDNGVFDRYMLQLVYSGTVERREFFWGTEVRSRHSAKFREVFDRLLAVAERCDPDGIIADAIRDGSHGRIYRFIVDSRPEAAPTGG